MSRSKLTLSVINKIVAIISSIYGVVILYFGMMSFTYFTNLSNIFITIVLIVFLVKDLLYLLRKKELVYSNMLYIIKFMATISITLTFLVFMFLLAPTFPGGIISAYLDGKAGSLCVHFITPLLAILDFIFFDDLYKPKKVHSLYAIVPPLVYTLFVVIAGSLGLRWGTMMAPYNFMNYGAKTRWFGFDLSIMGAESLGIGVFYMIVILVLIFIGIGHLFLLPKIRKEKMNK